MTSGKKPRTRSASLFSDTHFLGSGTQFGPPIEGIVSQLNLPNPIAIFPHSFDGGEITRIEDIFGGGEQFALFEIVPRVAGADGDELQHARIAVAINHAAGAAIAN